MHAGGYSCDRQLILPSGFANQAPVSRALFYE